jgi:glycosyltransferase involved in cell wall biosynthesis
MALSKRLLVYSRYIFEKRFYRVLDILCHQYRLCRFIITHEKKPVPRVYVRDGNLSWKTAGLERMPEFVTTLPDQESFKAKAALFRSTVRQVSPDYIWLLEEPYEYWGQKLLVWLRFRSKPRVIGLLGENIWHRGGGLPDRVAYALATLRWRRYDGLLAFSSSCIGPMRTVGMPRKVPISVGWAPILSPPPQNPASPSEPLIQRRQGDILLGFAGRITEAKGWKVLLAALLLLPDSIKCAIAGTGDQEAELRLWCSAPQLGGRVSYLGLLDHDQMWEFYRTIDILVHPCLTTYRWKEQFGNVLAEAMACGVPIIGSDSGSVPEVVANCGIIVEENNPAELARAILSLAPDREQRAALGARGMQRFQEQFTCEAYAGRLAKAFGLEK